MILKSTINFFLGGAAWTSLTDLSRQRDDVICEDGEANLRCSGRDDVIKVTSICF